MFVQYEFVLLALSFTYCYYLLMSLLCHIKLVFMCVTLVIYLYLKKIDYCKSQLFCQIHAIIVMCRINIIEMSSALWWLLIYTCSSNN
jgi:hypothetical protein